MASEEKNDRSTVDLYEKEFNHSLQKLQIENKKKGDKFEEAK
jgi:hypothetical protein